MGVSVENEKAKLRIDDLRSVPAKVRFLSCEPLLGPVPNMDLKDIHWVIVGGESGPKSRIMSPSWVEEIYTQCKANHIPFFFKQWRGTRKGRTGRLLHNRTYDEMPVMKAAV
jgi:protein gp37